MTRTKITERKTFSKEEKEFIKLKTGGKCGHCGKKLTDENTTVDHIIPVSKGGTNKEENLVCLCKDCNVDKSDMLADPVYFYPYMKEDYKEGTSKLFINYIENVGYEKRTNLMCIDILGCYVTKEESREAYQIYSDFYRKNAKGYNPVLHALSAVASIKKLQLRRAVYKDLDAIYNMMKSNLGYSKEEAYDKINTAFINYSMYVFKTNSSIVGFFFLIPRRLSCDRNTMILSIEDFYYKYDKYKSESVALLEGFCSFLLSKKSFLMDFIAISSPIQEVMGFLSRNMSKEYYHSLQENTVSGKPVIFASRESILMSHFCYIDTTEYQEWLQGMYNTKTDRKLSPILKHSRIVTKGFSHKYLQVALLREPSYYLGNTVVTNIQK